MQRDLYAKYNVPGPRYTSYPTVPYWDQERFARERWLQSLDRAIAGGEVHGGISVYVHLPFCERLCTFCGCTRRITRNHAVEAPYVEAVLAEWALHRARWGRRVRLRELHLGGGTPTFFSPESLARLVSGLLEDAEVVGDAEFGFEAHPNSTTEAHLRTLHGLGFRRLSLGIQDFDPAVQEAIHRVQSYEQVASATRAARAIGYTSVNFDLVYGLPKQRLSSVEHTVARVLDLRPDRIAFYSYAHVPWIRGVAQRGFSEADLPKNAEKRALYETGRQMLEAAGYSEIGMDHFALPGDALSTALAAGTLHRNFMGYTPVHTQATVGLGMSAIGETTEAFAQNAKRLDEYQEAVTSGRIPVLRGHLLDEEDRFVRERILDLMCRMRTRWDAPARWQGLLEAARARLEPMEQDGLVAFGEGWLVVTPDGKPFLRNVCMALDARLWRQRPGTRIFSQTI